MAAVALLRLGALINEQRFTDEAYRTLQLVGRGMGEQPLGFGNWLVALDWWLTPTIEFALVGQESGVEPFTREIYSRFLPNKVVVQAEAGDKLAQRAALIPLLQERTAINGQPTAYLCRNFTCQRPVTDATELADQIEQVFA
jgi:hypothetical protein